MSHETYTTTRPRVLLVDDHELVLDALECLLADEWNIVGKIHDVDAVLPAIDTVRPDLVLLDISMPRKTGLELASEIRRQFSSTKLVFMTMNEDAQLAAEAFRRGASAYVLKRSAASELSTAMHAAVAGTPYITPSLTGAVMRSVSEKPKGEGVALTERQTDVLRLLARGYGMKEVASALNITTRTVAFHKYQMMTQLGLKASAELIQYAVRRSIV